MAAVQSPRPPAGRSPHYNVDAAAAAVHRALDLLGRASEEWRNGAPRQSGSLHWPVAVSLARRELRQALEALERARDLRELLTIAAQRLRGWSAGAEPDGWLIASIQTALSRCPAQEPTADTEAGMAWWNSITRAERAHWLEVAGSAVPADAWRAFQAGGPPK